jgi:hypothetical protein
MLLCDPFPIPHWEFEVNLCTPLGCGLIAANGYDILLAEGHSHRSLDHLDRNDQASLPVAAQEDPFNAGQRSTDDAHTIALLQKRSGGTLESTGQGEAQGFNLIIRDGQRALMTGDKIHGPGWPQRLQSHMAVGIDVYEKIARKQGHFNALLAVCPLPHFR